MFDAFTLGPLAALTVIAASTACLTRVLARRHGVAAIVLPSGDDAHAFIGLVFKVAATLGATFCVAYAIRPTIVDWLGPLRWLMSLMAAQSGMASIGLGSAIVISAQIGMGGSWRVGIDPKHSGRLVDTGLYRFSRNPIYVGMFLVVAGIFLVAPNAATVAMLAITATTVPIQVRLEEEHLSRVHGASYAEYRARTRRWI